MSSEAPECTACQGTCEGVTVGSDAPGLMLAGPLGGVGEFFTRLFDTDAVPRAECVNQDQAIIWTHIVGDAGIILAYYTIPLALLYFIWRRGDLAFNWIFAMFAAFILACGTTHIFGITAFWWPTYRAEGVSKLITAGISLTTAVAVWLLIPRALKLPSPAQLREANASLADEVAARRLAQVAVQDSYRVLEERIQERTAELAESEARLRATFENAAVGIAHIAPDGRWLRVNERLCSITGYTREELLQKSFSDVTHPDDLDQDWADANRLLAGEISSYSMEKRYIRKDGTVVPVMLTRSLLRKADGSPDQFVAIINDISARKAAEEARERADARYRLLFEAIDEGFCIIEMIFDDTGKPVDFRYVEANAAFERHTGFVGELGRRVRELVPDIDESWFRIYGEVALTRQPVRFQNEDRAMGRAFDVYAFPTGEASEGRIAVLFTNITERTAAEQALRSSEERFAKAFLASPDGMAISRARDGLVLEANDAMLRICGLTREEMVGQRSTDLGLFADPADRERGKEILEREGRLRDFELTIHPRGGPPRNVLISSEMLELADEPSILSILRDVTESKRAAAELEFQKYALDQASIVAITDVKGTITYVNDTFCKISGYSREELLGQNHRILNSGFHPAEFFREMYTTIVRGEVWRGEIRNRRKDGSLYWVDTTIVPFIGPHGKPESYIAIRNDITERKRNEEQLEFQKYALDQASIVAITDVKGTITYVNDTFCKISGYSREELLGQNHRILNSGLHPREFFRDMYATISRGKVWRGEIRNRRKDGSFYWVDTTIVPSLGPGGKPDSYVAIRTDITERKRNEEALQSANADLLQFASAASHDLKEPLRGISRIATFIRDDEPDLCPRSGERLERIRTLCERLNTMVNGLLEHARTGLEPRSAPCDVNQLVRRVIDNSAEELSARGCEIIVRGMLPTLLADRILLERVFANLISNAVKFNDSPVKHVEIFWDETRNAVAIRDNGIGIDPRHHDAAFRIFKRVHSPDRYPGVGLGLALARKIVEAHSGSLELESSLGAGSTFWIHLPVVVPGTAGHNGSATVLISPSSNGSAAQRNGR